MAAYHLTKKAEEELDKIYEYSILNFGLSTAQKYLYGIHKCFLQLSENQSWGNDYSFIKTNLHRYEYRSHSIYYEIQNDTILIVRVLGFRQDPARHFQDME